MFKYFLVNFFLICGVGLAFASVEIFSTDSNSVENTWYEFKIAHRKAYRNSFIERKRYKINLLRMNWSFEKIHFFKKKYIYKQFKNDKWS